MSFLEIMFRRDLRVARVLVAAVGALALLLTSASQAADEEKPFFQRIPIQFIAALGDPNATSGTGAEEWGIWRVDPGPRGVWLRNFDKLEEADGVASANWKFDSEDWWLDENGLIMEKPAFPIPPGKYVVTGDREAITVLTIHPKGEDGRRRWELEDASLHDVTHMPCRSARYTPAEAGGTCSPASAIKTRFPVTPGGPMPAVEGCAKQDYSVLFIIGVEAKRRD